MNAYLKDLEQAAVDNEDFRRVVYTTHLLQMQFLSLAPDEQTGTRVHECDWFYLVMQGQGRAVVDEQSAAFNSGTCLLCPAGRHCNIMNTGPIALKLLALSAPPGGRPGATYRTRHDSDVDDESLAC